MLTFKRKLGDLGEKIALDYLKRENYNILDRNYQKKWGEIDIVAQKDKQEIVFIEVKTRKKVLDNSIGPEDSVGVSKQKRLIRTAQIYLLEKRYSEETTWQIDVIAVELDEKTRKADLKHIKNAVW
ncbi:MAG: hypothetical protein A3A94_01315 [Candidatus Portnoybacteria bacterium RIFCSPLOWO2_01_FULL_43_11]|uniref:UPF0102 protein A3I20_01535 n=3 Tax=Candidatus Portnoyibacteriota TaxID=1817913 RepID=A0A1G2FS19_9BACT|nr:MAG: hypothetical protein A3D38_01625 [Candidatus Portnoybacteria bacterium RIFCSPHIGHO2_02_FULL_40_23]OGZ37884.1 MAG: hypothetical protein A3A94_01315 [Candidatus Portnoybacteria bacterium RIFCSPLOWO2_01_FULL_43_11]OGZ38127.1 MAG: hypothetical protein A3E90_01750 [Candidatus Portnoybacteria bacterium RIFCSPHIGHO2_12_FULL_40_11]OGZ40885.1 MAG: hypothetical protein A3I20_01535 [Candidatus Portnoybacteria bacterium RIFCSPLOWO2_02_FULL_40_15]